VERRCILCGKKFETEEMTLTTEEEEDIFTVPRKSVTVCPLCQAKLKHEADEAQKVPKPM
jgi:NAD-dependent SIR2 family protein deacetylase